MKAAQVDKLYSKLTPSEQAALAFEAMARQDKTELDTIVDSVERRNYRCTHWDYRWRLMGLTNLAKFYGLIYWKTRTQMLTAICQAKENNEVLAKLLVTSLRQAQGER